MATAQNTPSNDGEAGFIITLRGAPLAQTRISTQSRNAGAATVDPAQVAEIARAQRSVLDALGVTANSPRPAARSITGNSPASRTIKTWHLAANAVFASELEDSELAALQSHPDVIDIRRERILTTTLDRSPQAMGERGEGALAAWDRVDSSGRALQGTGITIGILDTGIDYNHFDLGGCFGPGCKVVGGYDFINMDDDPIDDQGHGTHVAATAAGNGFLRGVAPQASLVAIKVMSKNGTGPESVIMDGLEYAMDPNADCADIIKEDYAFRHACMDDHLDIINLSLGLKGGKTDDPLAQYIDNVVKAGVIVVVAAGNDGSGAETIGTPGSALRAITVGNLDVEKMTIARNSSRGPVRNIADTQLHTKPDLVAPGTNICAAKFDGDWNAPGVPCGALHYSISGTSMAAPHVAGAAALALQLNPGWSPEQVKQFFMNTAVDLGFEKESQGRGLVNLEALADTATSGAFTVRLNSPAKTIGTFDIEGVVAINEESKWLVSLTSPKTPGTWSQIASGQLTNGDSIQTFLEDFDLRDLTPGVPYQLRLSVTDSERTLSDTVVLWSDHLNFTQVDFQYPSFNFVGRVDSNNIDRYTIEAKASDDDWENAFIVFEGAGAVSISDNKDDGVIGTWDTFADGFYDLRISIYRNGIENIPDATQTLFDIFLDTELQLGWPSQVPGQIRSPAIVRDLDNDGENEVIVKYRSSYTTVSLAIFDDKGRMLRGWPQVAGPALNSQYHVPMIYDTNGDGDLDVVMPQHYKPVAAFSKDGTVLPNPFVEGRFTKTLPSSVGWMRTDVEGDGEFEVIQSFDRGVFIYAANGTLRQEVRFAQEPSTRILRTVPAVGDLDGDGLAEIVVADGFGWVYIFSLDKPQGEYSLTATHTTDITKSQWYHTQPALADLDGDNVKEIIITTAQGLLVLYADGTPVPGDWPKANRTFSAASPVLADLDGDLLPEIIEPPKGNLAYLSKETLFHAWKMDGSAVPGWPAKLYGVGAVGLQKSLSHPVVADIDNDGMPEIIIAPSSSNTLSIIEHDGTTTSTRQLALEPVNPLAGNYTYPTVADIDNDGDLEVILGTEFGRILAWDFPGASTGPIAWPSLGGNDARTGVYIAPNIPVVTPTQEPTPDPGEESPTEETQSTTAVNCPNSVFPNGKMYDADSLYVDNACVGASATCPSVYFYETGAYTPAACKDATWQPAAAEDVGSTPVNDTPVAQVSDSCPNSVFSNGNMYDKDAAYVPNACATHGAACESVYFYALGTYEPATCNGAQWVTDTATPIEPEVPAVSDICPNAVFDTGKMYDASSTLINNECETNGTSCSSVYFYAIGAYAAAICQDARWQAHTQ